MILSLTTNVHDVHTLHVLCSGSCCGLIVIVLGLQTKQPEFEPWLVPLCYALWLGTDFLMLGVTL